MTPAAAIAKLRELRESDPLDTTVFAHAEWSRASTVLEVEHARLVREAMEGAKRLKDAEATNTRLRGAMEDAARNFETLAASTKQASAESDSRYRMMHFNDGRASAYETAADSLRKRLAAPTSDKNSLRNLAGEVDSR